MIAALGHVRLRHDHPQPAAALGLDRDRQHNPLRILIVTLIAGLVFPSTAQIPFRIQDLYLAEAGILMIRLGGQERVAGSWQPFEPV